MKNQFGVQLQATQEMFDEVDDIPTISSSPVDLAKDSFLSNLAMGGKVHKILAWGDNLHPRCWRTICNWHFGRGLILHTVLPLRFQTEQNAGVVFGFRRPKAVHLIPRGHHPQPHNALRKRDTLALGHLR